jgi:predicted nucleic-acid-binding Zn-ribbon protein
VDSVPDPLLLRKCGSAGNRTWTSGSVARTLTTRSQRQKINMHYIIRCVCVNCDYITNHDYILFLCLRSHVEAYNFIILLHFNKTSICVF